MTTSIIIPTYNHQEFLADAIESALAQTVKCEIIVINDGSTDGSLAIAKGYEQYGVKVINQINKGLASARNTGIMNATGDYILPLDSDDQLLDECVEKLMVIAETTKADVVAPSFKTFGLENSNVILMPGPTVEDFKQGNRIGYCSLFKKSTLLEVGGYSPRMVWGYEDLALTFDLLKRDKLIVTTPEILWLYRTRHGTMITEAQKHHEELMAQIAHDNKELFHEIL